MKEMNRVEAAGRRVVLVLLAVLCISWMGGEVCAVEPDSAKVYTVETIPNVRLSNRLNHVSNPDGILQAVDVVRMNQVLNFLEDSLGIEVAVVAVRSIGEEVPRSFATELFKQWGLGQKGTDDGLLIQLVTDQRSVVFETGYGVEGVLPDAICYRLQQRYMVPDFRAGDFSAGMAKGVVAVTDYLLKSGYERGSVKRNEAFDGMDSQAMWLFAGAAILFLVGVAYVGYRRNRPRLCPRCGKRTLVYRGAQTLVEPTYFSEGMEEDVYRCTHCGYEEHKRRTTDRLNSGGGGGPIIFGGGGLGGFGGSDSGGSWGGGASGGGGSESRF